jgi:hypothetical protein
LAALKTPCVYAMNPFSSRGHCPAVLGQELSSPIRKQQLFKKHGESKQLHVVQRKQTNTMRAITASVMLSLPVDNARRTLAKNQDLCSGSRTIGIGILVQLADAFKIADKILAYAMALLDRFLVASSRDLTAADTPISTNDVGDTKQVAVACFMLASKFVGSSLLWIDDILRVVDLHCSSVEIESSEGMVLKSIDWSLHLTTGHTSVMTKLANCPAADRLNGSLRDRRRPSMLHRLPVPRRATAAQAY